MYLHFRVIGFSLETTLRDIFGVLVSLKARVTCIEEDIRTVKNRPPPQAKGGTKKPIPVVVRVS